jgi:SAM-dependent MidA family methyltransferase
MIETVQSAPSLAERLRERIKREGPITFHDWMKAALYDPSDGYYCRVGVKKWGREGDYRTSPERSSLFAATFARYFARLYHDLGRPAQWTIVEVGAGEGHFSSGVLQTLRSYFPEVFGAITYVIDEISSDSRLLAEQRLQPFSDRTQFKRLDEVEINDGIVFSNELLDAFPVHRIRLTNGQLQEFYVNVGGHEGFEWTIGEPHADYAQYLVEHFKNCDVQLAEDQVVEINLGIGQWLRRVAEQMRAGYVVSVDYGAEAEELYSSIANPKGTLRGFQQHRFVDDLLARPGEQDLTTTVNWSFVKSEGERLGFEVVKFERQDRFLLGAGLLDQFELESLQCDGEAERLRLSTAARAMILPDGMAAHFQVLVHKKTAQKPAL